MRLTALAWILALALASAGIDVAVHADAARGWFVEDVALMAAVATAGTSVALLPAAAVGVFAPRVGSVIALVSFAAVHSLAGGPSALVAQVFALVCVGLWWWRPRAGAWAVACAGLVAVAWGGIVVERLPVPSRQSGPNVVLVTLDTVRYDHTSVGGHPSDPTPNLRALATRGVAFDQAIATAPITGPSHTALLTGVHNAHLGVFTNGVPMGDAPGSLARVLRANGYHTGGFVSALTVHRKLGFAQGFDAYDDDLAPIHGYERIAWVGALERIGYLDPRRELHGEIVLSRAQRWLRRRAVPGPFFLWVHLYDAHAPYHPPPPQARRWIPDPPPKRGTRLDLPSFWPPEYKAVTDWRWIDRAYTAEIAWVDEVLGGVLAAAEARSSKRGMVVVVAGDHGENIGEGGTWFDHGRDLRDAVLHVPLVIAGSGVPEGARVPCQVSLVDVAPTVLHLLGLTDPHRRDGSDALAGVGACVDHDAYAAFGLPGVDAWYAARVPGHKAVLHQGLLGFDLDADPREESAVSPSSELAHALARFAGSAAEQRPIELEGLEVLGYVRPPARPPTR